MLQRAMTVSGGGGGGNSFLGYYTTSSPEYSNSEIVLNGFGFEPQMLVLSRPNYGGNTSVITYYDSSKSTTNAYAYVNGSLTTLTKEQLFTYASGTLTVKVSSSDRDIFISAKA